MAGLRTRWILGVTMLGVLAAFVVALMVGSSSQAESGGSPLSPAAAAAFATPGAQAGTELPTMRTEKSRTYRRPDGSFRAVISAAPVNFRNASGGWQPIDTRLKSDGAGGLETTAAATEVALPAGLDDPAKVSSAGRWLSFELQGADPVAPTVSGDTATYAEVMDGVDAAYAVRPTGVKETLTLADAGAPSTYRFELAASPGLRPSLRDDGAIVIRDVDGVERFWIPAPTVKAAGDKVPTRDHVAYRLADDGRSLDVVVDPAWLAGASFPVEVDPSVWTGAGDSCTLASGTLSTTVDCNDEWLKVGHDTDHVYRSALRFSAADVTVPRIASVISAQLALTFPSQTVTDSVTRIDVAGLGKRLTDQSTWQSHDGTNAWTTPGGDVVTSPQPTFNTMYEDWIGGWVTFDIGALAEQWVRDPSSNNGLLLRAHDEGVENVLTFGGMTYAPGGPTLELTYALSPGLRDDQTYATISGDTNNSVAVNVTSGNLAATSHDIHLPGVGGHDLDVSRTYNSARLGDQTGVFGSAWTESINGAAFVNNRIWYDDARTIFADSGSVYRFDRDFPNDTPTINAFITPPGIDAELTVNSDTGIGTLTYADGRIWTYAESYDGMKFTLSRIDDGNGNHIDLTPDVGDPSKLASITDTHGDTLTFSRGLDGELTQITDEDDNEWNYTVDTTNGNNTLTSVEDPDNHTTTYTYNGSSADQLTKITAADGHDIDLEYGPDGDGSQITKIARQIDSNRDHDQVWEFDYTPEIEVGHACDADVASVPVIGRTVAIDPDGDRTTYCYNSAGEVIQTWALDATIDGDARVGETLRAVPGEVASTTRPSFTYRWQRCDGDGFDCEDLTGAATRAYTATPADATSRLRVIVTAHTAVGSMTATSAATVPVVAPLPRSLKRPVIAGRTAVGATMTLLPGTWEDGGDISHKWLRCDASGTPCEAIPSANGTSYTIVTADAGHVLVAEETATSDGGVVKATSRPSRVVTIPALRNLDAPTVSAAAGPDGSELVADPGTWDGDAPITYSYVWQRCDELGAGCSTALHSSGPYPLSSSDVGGTLRARVVASNPDGTATATTAASAVIEDAEPEAAAAPSVVGDARVGEVLTAEGATWTGTGPLDQSHRWQRCTSAGDDCVDIDGADKAAYVLKNADVGHRLRLIVEAANDLGTDEAVSATSLVVEEASGPDDGPTALVAPLLSGSPEVGETLGVDPGSWSGDGDVTYAYQWQRCGDRLQDCRDIEAADTASLTLGAGDESVFIRVLVTAQDDAGSTVVALTTATSVRAVDAPQSSTLPVISGTARDGEQLSVTTGTWSGVGALTFAIQWQVCEDQCLDLDDETGATYDIGSDDVDASLRAVVTAQDPSGRRTAVVTAATGLVEPAAPVNRDPPTISGDLSPGETIVAAPGTWEGIDPITFAYQWQRCDVEGDECSDIVGEIDIDYDVIDDDSGATLRVQVTADNAHGDRDEVSDATAPVVSTLGPQLLSSVTVSGLAREGETLEADHGSWSGTGTITYAYSWQLCDDLGQDCSRLPDATDPELTLSAAESFATVRVTVTARDDDGVRSSTSAATDIVVPEEPMLGDAVYFLSAPTVEGAPRVGEALTALPGTWARQTSLSFAYQWRACDADGRGCSAIDGATLPTYAPSDDLAGQRLRVAVTATGGGSSATVQSGLTDVVLPGLPLNEEVPTISGDPIDDSELVADDGTWQGATGDLVRQWLRCDIDGEECVDIEDATDTSYWTTSADVGSTLRVRVTAHNSEGETTGTSEPTSLIAPLAPVAWDIPFITGLAREDGTLTAEAGWFGGTREMTFTYAWERCDDEGENCTPVSGATAATYTLIAADLGSRMRVTMTATNVAGQGSSTSDPTDVVDAAQAPEIQGDDPSVDGDPHDGQRLTAQPGDWHGIEPMSFAYQWKRCGTDGNGCVDIVGAVTDIYDTTGADLGHRLRVAVTAVNPTGPTTVSSPPTPTITQADPEPLELPTLSGLFVAGHELTVEPGRWGGSAPSTYAYEWQRCNSAGEDCEAIDDATDDQYVLTDDDARNTIRAAVTATNSEGNATATSSATAVAPQEPENTELPQITGTLHTGESLHVSMGTWLHAPDSYTYRWESCAMDGSDCRLRPSGNQADHALTVFDAGRRFRATVWAMNTGAYDPPSAQSELTDPVVGPVPFNVERPTIVGVPQIGQPTVVDPGEWLADGEITYSYTWRWCYQDDHGTCEPFTPPVESTTYTPNRDDRGLRLRVTVVAETAEGGTEVDSIISAPVVSGPPHNIVEPTIEGPANVGVLLDLNSGQWNDSVEEMDVVWESCDEEGEDCDEVTTDDPSTYRVRHADLGRRIRATVTAASPLGQETVSTDLTDIVAAAIKPDNDTAPTVTGDATVGSTVTADPGTWSGTPGELDYSWLRCDPAGSPCASITGANDQDYVVRRADAGSVLRALVTMTNDWGGVSVRSDASDEVPDPPAVSSLMAPSTNVPWWQTPMYGATIGNADQGTWAGSPQTITDQWQRCDPLDIDPQTEEMTCVDIPGATDLGEYVPVAEDVGFALRLKETASSDGEDPVISYSDPTSAVVAVDATTAPILHGLPASGQTFTADAGAENAADLPTTVTYKFVRGTSDLVVQDGDSPTYELTDDDIGFGFSVTMTVTVWRHDSSAPVSVTNAYAYSDDVQAALANDTPPTVSGDLTVGAVQSADPGTWHGGGGELQFTYAWQRCDEGGVGCVDIVGAGQQTYASTMADAGHELRVLTKAIPGGQEAAAVTVASTSVGPFVVGDAPVNGDPPSITGTPAEREPLTADPGTWTGSDPINYTYQWQSCEDDRDGLPPICRALQGADQQTYVPVEDDLGRLLRVAVTARNGMGAATAYSEIGDLVGAGAPPSSEALPSLSLLGANGAGSTLVTDGGRWSKVEDKDLSYSWQRCDWIGASCVTIDGAMTQSYDLTSDDEGKRLQVTVSASNNAGTVAVASDLSDTIGQASGSAEGEITYVGEGRGDLRLALPDGSNDRQLTTCAALTGSGCVMYRPRISPNLKMIAVEVREALYIEPGDGDIYLLNVDGSGSRHLVKGSDPAWSQDGTEILYTTSDDGGQTTRAQIVGADGLHTDEPVSLVPGVAGSQASPDAAEDGTIVYTGREDGLGKQAALFLLSPSDDEPTPVPLSAEIASVSAPQFSADGTSIVFQAVSRGDWDDGQPGRSSIWKVNRDGSDLTRISPNTDDTYLPATAGTDTIIYTVGGYVCLVGSGGGMSGGGCGPTYSPGQVWTAHIDGSDPQPLGISRAFDASRAPARRKKGPVPPCDAGQSLVVESASHIWFRNKTVNGVKTIETVTEENAAVNASVVIVCDTSRVIFFKGDLSMKVVPHSDIVDPLTPKAKAVRTWKPNSGLKTVILNLTQDCVPGARVYNPIASYKAVGRGSVLPLGLAGELMWMRCNSDGNWRYRAWKVLRGRQQGRVLEKAMKDAGRPRPAGGGWAAHHIIPAFDKRFGAVGPQRLGYACRIRPHSALNGVWVPKEVHDKMHKERYYRYVDRKLRAALIGVNSGCNYVEARSKMEEIRERIEDDAALGTYPQIP